MLSAFIFRDYLKIKSKFVIESNPKFGIIQFRRSTIRTLKFDEFVKSRIHQVFGVSYLVFGMK